MKRLSATRVQSRERLVSRGNEFIVAEERYSCREQHDADKITAPAISLFAVQCRCFRSIAVQMARLRALASALTPGAKNEMNRM